MTATERIKEMLTNSKVDNVGASGWYHTPECDRKSSDVFSKRIIGITDYNNWDFIKIMSNGIYMQEAYGSDIEYYSENIPLELLRSKMIFKFRSYLVNNERDMRKFPVLNARENKVYQREAALIRALAEHYKGAVPIIPTIFLPAHTIPEFTGGIPVAKTYFDECPDAVDHMLKSLFETEKQVIEMYLEAGADGFFFATRFSNSDIITRAQFERFCMPYEKALVKHSVDHGAWFNMMHIHGTKNFYWDYFNEYDVQAYNWENVPHDVSPEERASVAYLRSITDRILISGTDQFADFYGSTDEVLERFMERLDVAARESEDNRFIFAPGCSLPLDIDEENVHQLRVAVDRYNSEHVKEA